MKGAFFVFLTLCFLIPSSQAIPGSETGNGGNFTKIMIMETFFDMERLLDLCLHEPSQECLISHSSEEKTFMRSFLEKIKSIHKEEIKNGHQILFIPKESPSCGTIGFNGLDEIAVTGSKVGDLICIKDGMFPKSQEGTPQSGSLINVLVHELGHHHHEFYKQLTGIQDFSKFHDFIYYLGLTVGRFFDKRPDLIHPSSMTERAKAIFQNAAKLGPVGQDLCQNFEILKEKYEFILRVLAKDLTDKQKAWSIAEATLNIENISEKISLTDVEHTYPSDRAHAFQLKNSLYSPACEKTFKVEIIAPSTFSGTDSLEIKRACLSPLHRTINTYCLPLSDSVCLSKGHEEWFLSFTEYRYKYADICKGMEEFMSQISSTIATHSSDLESSCAKKIILGIRDGHKASLDILQKIKSEHQCSFSTDLP